MFLTFAQSNPDFSGAYIAIADDDISTVKMFDSKTEMNGWIRDMLEIKGYEKVTSTVMGNDGSVDKRLNHKSAIYEIDPEISTNIRVTYQEF
jgi:hypothetical protein